MSDHKEEIATKMNQIDQRSTHDQQGKALPRVRRECERSERAWYARRKNLFLLPRSRALGRVPVKTMFFHRGFGGLTVASYRAVWTTMMSLRCVIVHSVA